MLHQFVFSFLPVFAGNFLEGPGESNLGAVGRAFLAGFKNRQ